MITRLGSVPVFVTDQESALIFFRDKLGLKVVVDYQYGPEFRWLTLAQQKGGTEIALFRPVPSIVGDSLEELRKRIGVWTGIVFLTDDIDQTYKLLRERGVEFNVKPRQQSWGGWEALFNDPDGNGFHLVQRPASGVLSDN
jgi:catechol 2,3-dioxygenase-like lactoylglutathione lyase family enzyme